MKKKILSLVLALLVGASVLAGCGGGNSSQSSSTAPAGSEAEGASSEATEGGSDIKYAIIFGMGGLGDNGYNDEVYEGCLMAKELYGVDFDYVEPKEISVYETQLRMFADSEEYDLIIAISSDQVDAMRMVAADYPDQQFTMVDTVIEGLGNIHSVSASHPEQHFLSGMLAGLAVQDDRFPLVDPTTNILGFTIAMDNPVSRAQATGFIAGAKYVNPDVEILTSYIGSYSDPGKAKEIAMTMYGRGADIVSQNAGSSGMGVFAAAAEADKYVIGTSLAMVDPDHSLSTSRKKVEEFIVQEVASLVDGTWAPGADIKGIADGICDYDIENLNTEIPADIIEKLDAAKAKIAAGELPMPNDLDEVDDWAANHQLAD